MVEAQATPGTQLPLHRLIDDLDAWRAEPSSARRDAVKAAVDELIRAYGVRGVELTVNSPAMPTLQLAAGSTAASAAAVTLALAGAPEASVQLRIDADALHGESLKGALLVALAWTRLFPELWRMQRFPDQA
jgi:hypothetical protein